MVIDTKERWTKDVERYDLPHLRLRQVAEIVKQLNPLSYVDLGCAKGTLGTLTPGIKYVGCDFALPEGEHGFEFHHCDFNRDSLPDQITGSELITCSGLLEYIEDMDAFLRSIAGALKANGKIVVTYFNMNHIQRTIGLFQGKTFPTHPDWRNFYSPNDFRHRLRQNGFAMERIIPSNHSFGASAPVSETLNAPLKLLKYRVYSNYLAHQFIYVCRKK